MLSIHLPSRRQIVPLKTFPFLQHARLLTSSPYRTLSRSPISRNGVAGVEDAAATAVVEAFFAPLRSQWEMSDKHLSSFLRRLINSVRSSSSLLRRTRHYFSISLLSSRIKLSRCRLAAQTVVSSYFHNSFFLSFQSKLRWFRPSLCILFHWSVSQSVSHSRLLLPPDHVRVPRPSAGP